MMYSTAENKKHKRNPTQKALRQYRRKMKKILGLNFSLVGVGLRIIGPKGAAVICRIRHGFIETVELDIESDPMPKNLANSLYKKIARMLRRKEPIQWTTDLP